jgi:hypothetical protein
MRSVDSLPIFGREPQAGPFTLFTFEVAMRTPSDVKNWHSRNGRLDPWQLWFQNTF